MIKIRQASLNDSLDIFNWRNDILTRKMSIQGEVLDWKQHEAWYQNALLDPNRYLYIGYLDQNNKIGLIRFDMNIENQLAEVSINLNPIMRGQGLSSSFLRQTIELFHQIHYLKIMATIKKNNLASIHCFLNCGFILKNEELNFYHFFYETN